MKESPPTITERLTLADAKLTRAERQLASSLLANYPFSGLGSITRVAREAGVSTPTVARMVKKLGFSGFPEFQAALRSELEATVSGPIAKHDDWASEAPESHILNRFTEAAVDNVRHSIGQLSVADFDRCCDLLQDTDRTVFIVGGRITRTLADYLFLHLQVVRPGVIHIPSNTNAWPHYMLNVKEGDVVVVFDVRRYENSTRKLAEIAAEKGAKIILFTDQWRSPIHRLADCTIAGRIAVPSAWDSNVTLLLLAETVLASVQERLWDDSRDRVEALEAMFDRTRFFRKFT